MKWVHWITVCTFEKNYNKVKLLLFYVDNILLLSKALGMMSKIKEFLKCKFEMEDIGETAYVLDIRISRDKILNILYLYQKIYKIFGMKNCKFLSILIWKSYYLNKSMCQKEDEEINKILKVSYAQDVASCMWWQI